MSTAIADKNDIEGLKFTFRWKKWLLNRNPNGNSILTASGWTKENNDDDIIVSGAGFDAESTTVSVQGGTVGREYVLVNSCTTSDGETPARRLTVRIVRR